jgi:Nif-specific regulatory protein
LGIFQRINSERELLPLLNLLTREIKKLLRADLVSVFLFDREKCELCSIVSHDNQKIFFDARLGIAGAAAMKGETINVLDAYEHPLFYREVDSQTGYRTQTILAVPLKNARAETIGVCEAINKQKGPFNQEDIEILEAFAAQAANAIETAQLVQDLKSPQPKLPAQDGKRIGQSYLQHIVGLSPKVQSIVRLIDQIRDSSVDVLIQGESGTGKDLVAKALHYNSPRAGHPFIALNCAALPDNLVEAELFGIEKGVATGVDPRAGRFEAASGGTLFLDEIRDLSLAAQAKILRVLQERSIDRLGGRTPIPVNLRIIAATNKDLEAAIRQNAFREDLFYRLKVIHIQMPPLREIPEDIPLLANHFLSKYCRETQAELKRFTAQALARMTDYHWPGNERQLENEVKRLVASVRGRSITENYLDAQILTLQSPAPLPKTLPDALVELERRMIEEALRESRGNKLKAAQTLGLSRQGLIKKMSRLAISSSSAR